MADVAAGIEEFAGPQPAAVRQRFAPDLGGAKTSAAGVPRRRPGDLSPGLLYDGLVMGY